MRPLRQQIGRVRVNAALACENISVRYGDVQALDDVSLEFEAGKIHALLGQNGAGKTTLVRFLSGLVSDGTGRLSIGGSPITPGDPAAVRDQGLATVHQRFTLPPTFTVANALELTASKGKGRGVFLARAVAEAWAEDIRQAGISASPNAIVSSLPVETVQSLEILRALAGDARILILDEPTALLSPGSITDLFGRLRRLRDQGVSLLIVLHKLQEVQELADTVSILRDGRLVLSPCPIGEASTAELSDLMIGTQAAVTPDRTEPEKPASDESGLSLVKVNTVPDPSGGAELREVTFSVGRSEILGIAGIEGNGQRRVAELLCGFCDASSGKVTLGEMDLLKLSPGERRRQGVRVVPFDRMSEGASLDSPLWENVLSWRAEEFSNGRMPIIPVGRMKESAAEALSGLGVRYSSLDQPAVSLSGGNLQRLVLARELIGGAVLLVAAQPTRGLDFRAAKFVLQCLRRLRNEGSAILLISSDLDELFEVSDRLAVMRGGMIAGEFEPPYSRQLVGDAMVGAAR